MKSRRSAALVLLSLAPGIACANAGIPMLALAWPLHWLALVPVVALEAALVARAVGLPYRELVWPVTKANLLSTFVGVPLAWAAMLALQFLVLGGVHLISPDTLATPVVPLLLFPFTAAWLINVNVDDWSIYAAFVVLAIPFCVASIVAERWSLSVSLPRLDVAALRAGARRANVVSYALMIVATLAWPLLT